MSMKNYSKMYAAEEETQPFPVPDTDEENPVVEEEPMIVTGTVVNCVRLNVREQMNTGATVLCVLPAGAEVEVIADEEHDEWYHVITATGIEGFCMKNYIQL